MDYVEEFDKLKTKVLKYILFKKRTEQEVRQKFKEDSGELLDDVIEELKELGYINDEFYIQKAVNEFRNLKNMSIKEIEYKLMTKGLKKDIDAVENAVVSPLSNGFVEGINNRTKMIKRVMYGRKR